jgi:hypothetical protein
MENILIIQRLVHLLYMNLLIIIAICWLVCGTIFLVFLSFYLDKTIKPLIKHLVVLQKFVDRNNGVVKKDSEYQSQGSSPVVNLKKLEEPDGTFKKINFNILLFSKILLFYWIIYLIICGIGFILLQISPNLKE